MRNIPRYLNYDEYPRDWTPWKTKFLWWPRKIEGKTRWLVKMHERHKGKFLYYLDHGDPGIWTLEFQYAFDIFDMMRYENE
jgi:hypothetical protein